MPDRRGRPRQGAEEVEDHGPDRPSRGTSDDSRATRVTCDPCAQLAVSPRRRKPVMSTHFEIPRLRILARHALPNVIEGTLIPVGLFLVMLQVLGLWGAMVVGLGWSYVAILRRVVARRPVPGIMILGSVTLTARSRWPSPPAARSCTSSSRPSAPPWWPRPSSCRCRSAGRWPNAWPPTSARSRPT